MKAKIIITLGVLLSLPLLAQASSKGERSAYGPKYRDTCVVELQKANGRTLDIFEARRCIDARELCQDELRWRNRNGRNMRASCVTVKRPDRNRGRRVIEEVHFWGNTQAQAIRKCRRHKRYDNRCFARRMSCSPCSQNRRSGHSSYLIYSNRR